MSQSTAKATGRRTPQTKGKQGPAAAAAAAAPVDGSMVVSINMMDRGTVEEYLEAPKVVVASPKDTKSTTTKNSGDKTNGGITKEEQKASSTESHQNGSSTSEKKGENGVGGEKAAAPEVTNGEGKIRESPRQKAQKENEKKAAQMEQNETKKLEAEKKIIDQKSEQQQKSPEQKAEKKSDKVELNASTVSTASLAKEKELKGFHEDGSEAVSIVLKKDDVGGSGAATFDSPRPNKTPGKGLKTGTTPNRARISPFRKSERLQNVSTAVNLSTVSEQSNEVAQSPNVDQSFGSLRHISGRRSFTNRPVREYTFQNFQRESYRKLPDGYDDSISSVNATVGSDLHNDSFRTPIVASVKGRKRELTPQDSDDDIRIVDKTPGKSKRPRLDLSAFLGFMASPVTLLRNKFQKANIQSSTPNQSFSVEELDKEATNGEKEKEMDVSDPKDKSMEEDELKKSIDMGQDVLLTDDMELLKEKHEDAEMKTTSLQVRRVCNVM
ncbi:uncharacterized protein LOC129787911 [Lutzomyia longipalpis]|uniref:uncharacterized protein LOC129787911 n=1 Tax=Lutzomyia longipalpis TaxID=7200 RepID=UPI002483507D|nr:uncharacterized protein LOC129787911 [Lutzomyia longipalpis]